MEWNEEMKKYLLILAQTKKTQAILANETNTHTHKMENNI